MAVDPTLIQGYIGSNRAHLAFKREIVAAKVRFMHAGEAHAAMELAFRNLMTDAPGGGGQPVAVGRVTEVLGPTQVRLLNIPRDEAKLITGDFATLDAQLHSLMYCDLQRVLESYLLDLVSDVALTDSRVLMSNRTITWQEALAAPSIVELLLEKHLLGLSHSNRQGLQDAFDRMGLPIIPAPGSLPEDERGFLEVQFRLLWGLRNLVQHNHAIMSEDALVMMPECGYAVGERVVIDTIRLGRAFAAVEGIADQLNQRAVAKYSLTAAI